MHRRLFCRYRLQAHHADGEDGFTLVEVIVALAVLALGLNLVLTLTSGALNWLSAAQRMGEAGSLAQSLLSEAGTEFPIKPQQRDGQYASGYRWRLTMLPYGQEFPESSIALYQISAEIDWSEGAGEKSYVLTTLRLGPKAARS